jgi:hypothetical protein
MPAYSRPIPPPRIFVNGFGRPILYGQRWDGGSPPDDTYSVTSNLDRFEPLHDIADALIAWLAESYDVSVEESPVVAEDLPRPPADALRAVRVRPADRAPSPLTFVFTPFPGVYLHAGYLHDAHFPSCGCDACDDTWSSCGSALEETVFAVVAGGLSESIIDGIELGVTYRLQRTDGWSGGESRAVDYPADRLDAVRAELTARRVWAPWPAR